MPLKWVLVWIHRTVCARVNVLLSPDFHSLRTLHTTGPQYTAAAAHGSVVGGPVSISEVAVQRSRGDGYATYMRGSTASTASTSELTPRLGRRASFMFERDMVSGDGLINVRSTDTPHYVPY
ncbi:unnamed protein product, partial [Iphiclides podalirius]